MSLQAENFTRIALLPIGPVSNDLLEWCKDRLPQIIVSEVVITRSLSIPDRAYDAHRKQFLGDTILEELETVDIETSRLVGRRCIMHFSNTLQDTDLKGPDFCGPCFKRLSKNMGK